MITGKGKQHGHNVSFSQRRTNKTWSPNMQTKTVVVDGQKVRLKVSAKGIRTLKKKGALVQAPSATKQVTA
jgi:large subunit ribosomal protein L28